MFKASARSSAHYATRPELFEIHAGQRIKNRCLDGLEGRLADPSIRAGAVKFAPALSLALERGNHMMMAAAGRGKLDEMTRHGCVDSSSSYSAFDLGQFMLPDRDEFRIMGYEGKAATEKLVPLAIRRLREQYDFSRAEENLESLLRSSKFQDARQTDPEGDFGKPAQMLLQLLANTQIQFGSEWLVVVDEPSMRALRPDLMAGGLELTDQGRP
jgi:hypothetical protein